MSSGVVRRPPLNGLRQQMQIATDLLPTAVTTGASGLRQQATCLINWPFLLTESLFYAIDAHFFLKFLCNLYYQCPYWFK